MWGSIQRRWRRRRDRSKLIRAGLMPSATPGLQVLGSGLGAWTIVPDALPQHPQVFTFGIGRDLSFERDLIALFDAKVHAFDPTPVSLEWVATQDLPPGLHCHPFGLGPADRDQAFFFPVKERSHNFSPIKHRARQQRTVELPVRRLSTLLAQHGVERLDLLKIDIEGGEYDILEDVVQCPVPIQQLLIEFHHTFHGRSTAETLQWIRRLAAVGHSLVAVSARTTEFTFVQTGANANAVGPQILAEKKSSIATSAR